jgi:hypothetical protein
MNCACPWLTLTTGIKILNQMFSALAYGVNEYMSSLLRRMLLSVYCQVVHSTLQPLTSGSVMTCSNKLSVLFHEAERE